ncbi:DUF664 domain-containing protein [Streptomyces nigra]|uniref:mycothiol transferase n=1 Tax=Streptomyces nigra TaxID=1827580 RepID=UPI0030D3FF24
MTTTTTPDGRPVPPAHADERTMLEAWLDFHRATLALKCAGLDGERLRRPAVPPSRMTLLGLVQHMAEVERNWFQRVFASLDVPPVFGEDNTDGFTLAPGPRAESRLPFDARHAPSSSSSRGTSRARTGRRSARPTGGRRDFTDTP